MRLASRQPVTLIGGAPVPRADLDAALALAPVLAAADGGADAALANGLVPQAVWGDFDSISPQARAAIPTENLHRIAEQDSTDFEKCLSRIDAPLVLAIGFCGARQDHFLAALNTLARGIGPPCILIADQDIVTAGTDQFVVAALRGGFMQIPVVVVLNKLGHIRIGIGFTVRAQRIAHGIEAVDVLIAFE